ncbi:flavonol 4'-sulfotransferase [Quercus suber]|uniref:Sulfotransferase n=1 Tax=Quercus suber TaxID=58331 RepID=A0AAW0KBM4_QUESU
MENSTNGTCSISVYRERRGYFTSGKIVIAKWMHIIAAKVPKAKQSNIIKVRKDPKDTFVALWHFNHKMSAKEEVLAMKDLPLEDAFEFFCEGLTPFGPYWDHLLGYWRASLESPENILFLKYEDLKIETKHCVKKIAQFMGPAFSLEEEDKGVVQKIKHLYSFENMSSLEVNKNGMVKLEFGITKDGVNIKASIAKG